MSLYHADSGVAQAGKTNGKPCGTMSGVSCMCGIAWAKQSIARTPCGKESNTCQLPRKPSRPT